MGVLVVLITFAVSMARAPTAHAGDYQGPFTMSELLGRCPGLSGDTQLGSSYYWYAWTADGGTMQCDSGSLIDSSEFDDLVGDYDAAANAAMLQSEPYDLSAADEAEGEGWWDSLSGAAQSVKTAAMDFLSGLGEWGGWDTLASTATNLGAFGAAAYLGFKLGSAIDDWLGFSSGGTNTTSWPSVTGFTPIPNGCALYTCKDPLTAYCPNTGNYTVCVNEGIVPGPDTSAFTSTLPTGTYGADLMVGALSNGVYTISSNASSTAENSQGNGTVLCSGDGWPLVGPPPTSGDPSPQWDEPATFGGSSTTMAGGWVIEDYEYSQTSWPTYENCLVTTYVYLAAEEVVCLPGVGQNCPGPQQADLTPTVNTPGELNVVKPAAAACLQSNAYPCGEMNDSLCNYDETQGQDECGDAQTETTPAISIPVPNVDETYGHYVARLQTAGFIGSITNTVLSADDADAETGPNDVVTTVPVPGSAVEPDTAITVETNPDSSAPPSGGTGTSAPAAPGISLPSESTPCSVFPFGIPCWLVTQLRSLETTPVAPSWSVHAPALFGGGSVAINLGSIFGLSTSGVMEVVSQCLVLLSFLGLMVWIGGMALGGNTTGGSGDGGES